MLNFRNTNIFFFILVILLAISSAFAAVPIFAYGFTFIAYLCVLAYGSYTVNLNFYMTVICSAKTQDKEIAISFDDGPDAEITPAILSILEKENIQAAFFLIGKKIPGREYLVSKLHADGHLIGNHSFSHHPLFDFFSSRKMLEDLQSMDQLIFNMLGLKPKLFRPPYGVTNPNLKSAVRAGGYKAIGWNIRSLDTVIKDEIKLLNKVTRHLRPGDIVLFHDTSNTTLSILSEFIQQVSKQGFKITRLDKMLKLEPYA